MGTFQKVMLDTAVRSLLSLWRAVRPVNQSTSHLRVPANAVQHLIECEIIKHGPSHIWQCCLL
jgi:hypothetical protein